MNAAAIAAPASAAPASKPNASEARGDADVDDRLAGAVEGRVEEGAELRGRPVARASVPSNRSKIPKASTRTPASSHELAGGGARGDARAEEADDVRAFGRQAEPAERRGDGGRQAADAVARRRRRRGSRSRGGVLPALEAQDAALVLGEGAGRPRGGGVETVSRPTRRVWIRPAARSRPRCHDTSGWLSPTRSMSSDTRRLALRRGAGRSAAGSRRRAPCGRGAGRAARRAGRRRPRWSSGCARGKVPRVLRCSRGFAGPGAGERADGSTVIYINMH